MGRPKYIYFNDENYNKLMEVDNASALINKLLEEFFGEADIKSKTKDLSEEISILEQKKQELETKEQERLTEEQKKQDREKRIKEIGLDKVTMEWLDKLETLPGIVNLVESLKERGLPFNSDYRERIYSYWKFKEINK